jgi:hypothetical protein
MGIKSRNIEQILNEKVDDIISKNDAEKRKKEILKSTQPPKVESKYLIESVRGFNFWERDSKDSSTSSTKINYRKAEFNSIIRNVVAITTLTLIGIGIYNYRSDKPESEKTQSSISIPINNRRVNKSSIEQVYERRFQELMRESSELESITVSYGLPHTRHNSFNNNIKSFAAELKQNPSSNSQSLLNKLKNHTYEKVIFYPETTRTIENNLNVGNKIVQTPFALIGDVASGVFGIFDLNSKRRYNGIEVDSYIGAVWKDREETIEAHLKRYRINPYYGKKTQINLKN